MQCSACRGEFVWFAVPPALQSFVPDGSMALRICSVCLVMEPAESGDSDPDFSLILEGFPDGVAGVAMALGVGLLVDSVALHNDTVSMLFSEVSAAGVDPWLVLERLCASPTIEPAVDLDRVRVQFEQLVD